jgi:hypothetical protein
MVVKHQKSQEKLLPRTCGPEVAREAEIALWAGSETAAGLADSAAALCRAAGERVQ